MKPNLWQRTKYLLTGNRPSQAARPRQRKVSPFMWPAYVDGQPQWQIIDYESYVNEGFNLNSLIYSAIMYKARAQISSPLRAYTGDVEDPQPLPPNDPLSKLVNRPNEHQSMVEHRQQAIAYINISGDNFKFLDRITPNGPADKMYNLRPDRVLILPGVVEGKPTIQGYVYVPEGASAYTRADRTTRAEMQERNRAIFILPQDMMHTKYPNPGDKLEGMGYGLSPISSMARSADVDNAITHFLKLFFDSGVMLPGLLSSDQPLDDTTIARTRERWKEMYGGYAAWAEEIAVLDRGTSYQRIGLAFDEMGFNEQDERNETRVLSVFGVPPILVGSRIGLNRSTYSNYEQARKAFWEDTMVPENALFEVDYQFHLNDGKSFVAFDYAQVPAFQELRQSHQDRMLEGLKASSVKRSEYRRAMGLPVEPEDDVYVVVTQQGSTVGTIDAAAPTDQTMDGAPEATDEDQKILRLPLKKKAL